MQLTDVFQARKSNRQLFKEKLARATQLGKTLNKINVRGAHNLLIHFTGGRTNQLTVAQAQLQRRKMEQSKKGYGFERSVAEVTHGQQAGTRCEIGG